MYDSKSNELVGFVLPLEKNGMPKPSSFKARSAGEIENHFLKSGQAISSYVFAIMAQPLIPGYPPFCLMIYGSDNKFTAEEVNKKWKFIKDELKKRILT